MKKKLLIVLIPLICYILIWGFSLLRCEIFTLFHGQEFETLWQKNTMIINVKFLKVLDYTDTHARIYYVSKGNSMGNLLVFTKKDDKWDYKSWDTVWSTSGNADNVVWPYWWHFFYSHRRLKD